MLKSIAENFSIIGTALVLAVVACVLLAGCKTAPSTATASIAVQYATAKYIEKAGTAQQQTVRAARIVQVLDDVDRLATASEAVVVSALRAYVAQRLPVDLSSADRILAGAIIDAAAAELEARVGEGTLPADKLLKVRDVLGWVRAGAAPYLAASS